MSQCRCFVVKVESRASLLCGWCAGGVPCHLIDGFACIDGCAGKAAVGGRQRVRGGGPSLVARGRGRGGAHWTAHWQLQRASGSRNTHRHQGVAVVAFRCERFYMCPHLFACSVCGNQCGFAESKSPQSWSVGRTTPSCFAADRSVRSRCMRRVIDFADDVLASGCRPAPAVPPRQRCPQLWRRSPRQPPLPCRRCQAGLAVPPPPPWTACTALRWRTCNPFGRICKRGRDQRTRRVRGLVSTPPPPHPWGSLCPLHRATQPLLHAGAADHR
jgi:hypothetical protein